MTISKVALSIACLIGVFYSLGWLYHAMDLTSFH
jgi:hypothetical protein